MPCLPLLDAFRPRLIVNAAAWTAVDLAEQQRMQLFRQLQEVEKEGRQEAAELQSRLQTSLQHLEQTRAELALARAQKPDALATAALISVILWPVVMIFTGLALPTRLAREGMRRP